MAGTANLARRLPTGAEPSGFAAVDVEGGDCCFKIKTSFFYSNVVCLPHFGEILSSITQKKKKSEKRC